MNGPLVSVIMPVHNAGPFLGEAIGGVLDQSFVDFELIIVDDGSTDSSGDVIRSFHDARIRHTTQPNQGVSFALNQALSMARGSFIARHDADDVSVPARLQRQLDHFSAHPGTVILGSWAALIDGGALPADTLHHPVSDAAIRFMMLFTSPFVSSSVMFRSEVLRQVAGFDTSGKVFDDYDMWSRIAQHGRAANLPEELVRYRVLTSGLTHTTVNTNERLIEQRRRNLALAMPEAPTELISVAARLGLDQPLATRTQLIEMKRMLSAVIERSTADPRTRKTLHADLHRKLMSYRTIPHHTLAHRALDWLLKRALLAGK